MAIIQQQLRSTSASGKPGDLEPGQLAYNLTDSKGYLGNGSSSKTLIDGSTTVATANKGWIEFPLKVADITALQEGVFLPDPGSFAGSVSPTPGQVLTWDATADGGTGGYVPVTPGSISVYTIANDDSNIGTSGTTTADLNAGLIAKGGITAASDLNSGDSCIVTDSGNADTSTGVPPGSYTWDGTAWLLAPSGGGATLLSELLNVSVPLTTVDGEKQGGFLVRDLTVSGETSPGAYKVVTSIDSGGY